MLTINFTYIMLYVLQYIFASLYFAIFLNRPIRQLYIHCINFELNIKSTVSRDKKIDKDFVLR